VLDDQLMSRGSSRPVLLRIKSRRLSFGRREVNENRPFTGLVDDVQVYNTALTTAQIQATYNAGLCP
jgi:hypothetical protein